MQTLLHMFCSFAGLVYEFQRSVWDLVSYILTSDTSVLEFSSSCIACSCR